MDASWVVIAIYMKGSEGFVSSELDEAGSEGDDDDGTVGNSSANAFWSLYQVIEREVSIRKEVRLIEKDA